MAEPGLGFVDDPAHFEIDLPGGLFAPGQLRRGGAVQAGVLEVIQAAENRAYAKLDNHLPGDLGGPSQIARAAVGGLAQGEFLGERRPPA